MACDGSMAPAATSSSRTAGCRSTIFSAQKRKACSPSMRAASRRMPRSISASAAPPTRRRSTTQLRVQGGRRIIEHQAIEQSSPRSRSGSRSRARYLAGGLEHDHPDAVAGRSPTCRSRASLRCSRRRRSIAPPRTPPAFRRHGRDARHAAPAIRARCARLPSFRRGHRRGEAAHRRGAGGYRRPAPSAALAAE